MMNLRFQTGVRHAWVVNQRRSGLGVGGQAPPWGGNVGLDLQDNHGIIHKFANGILFCASSQEETTLFDELISSPRTVRQLVTS